jgi:RES domain-containing protein
MGGVKNLMIERDERGYDDIDKKICEDCVGDEFLKNQIRTSLDDCSCDYCGKTSSNLMSAPVEVILDPIVKAIGYYFADPSASGVPYEQGYIVEPQSTHDVLESIEFDGHDDLVEDIVESLINDAWVPAADGHWASSHPNEIYIHSWNSFSIWVKHEARFFFSSSRNTNDEDEPQQVGSGQMLPLIARLVRRLQLVRMLTSKQCFFRVRKRTRGDLWIGSADTMGVPPADKATAGRMNPAGISYLYLAFDEATAIAEVVKSSRGSVEIAEFAATRPLQVLDLTQLPPLPSVFDDSKREELEGLLFLTAFIAAITEPIAKDGREHVEYAPSQVVSEYFALVFRTVDGLTLDGICYPSAVHPSGKNIVLFPTTRGIGREFASARFVRSSKKRLI